MITEEMYKGYFGVTTAPSNFTRLEYISLKMLKALMTKPIPKPDNPCYQDFQKALMEQMNFTEINETQLNGGSGASLGKFSEGSSDGIEANQQIKRISPIAYDILLDCGFLYAGMGC